MSKVLKTIVELRKEASRLKIKGRSKLKKKVELVKGIQDVGGNVYKIRKNTVKSLKSVSRKRRGVKIKVSRTQSKNGLATLSIKQPAAALILYRGKNVENRSKPKFREKFIDNPRWVLIQTGQKHQKKSILSSSQLEAASRFKKVKFVDTVAVMDGINQTTGSLVGAMMVSEQRPANKKCNSAWANDKEVHIMIKKTIAFTKPQKWKGQLCVFPVAWDQLNTTIKKQLKGVKGEFLMRRFPISSKKSRKKCVKSLKSANRVRRSVKRKVSRSRRSVKRKVSRSRRSVKRKVSRSRRSVKRKVSRVRRSVNSTIHPKKAGTW